MDEDVLSSHQVAMSMHATVLLSTNAFWFAMAVLLVWKTERSDVIETRRGLSERKLTLLCWI